MNEDAIYRVLEKGRNGGLSLRMGLALAAKETNTPKLLLEAIYVKGIAKNLYSDRKQSITLAAVTFLKYLAQSDLDSIRKNLQLLPECESVLPPPIPLGIDPDTEVQKIIDEYDLSEDSLRMRMTIAAAAEVIPEFERYVHSAGINESTALRAMPILQISDEVRRCENQINYLLDAK